MVLGIKQVWKGKAKNTIFQKKAMETDTFSNESRPRYSSIGNTGDMCPTCRGIGRIPRGHEDQLVAVIPCNDIRLKPRRTKLYVCASMGVCLLVCGLILFFLFPRSVALAPVSLQSVMVYFTPDTVQMEVTNVINVTNENFVPIEIVKCDIQGLIFQTVVGHAKLCNMTGIQSRSQTSYTIQTDVEVTDSGLNTYCKSESFKIHTVFLELQISMNISYIYHIEQLSLSIYEYIDCGNNSTTPHSIKSEKRNRHTVFFTNKYKATQMVFQTWINQSSRL